MDENAAMRSRAIYISNVLGLNVYTVLSVFCDRVFGRGAEAYEDIEERDGGLSVHRQQRGSPRGQQTYLYQRSL